MHSTGLKATAAKQAISPNDRCYIYGSGVCYQEHDPNQKNTSVKKSYAPIAYGSKTSTLSQLKMSVHIRQRILSYFSTYLKNMDT